MAQLSIGPGQRTHPIKLICGLSFSQDYRQERLSQISCRAGEAPPPGISLETGEELFWVLSGGPLFPDQLLYMVRINGPQPGPVPAGTLESVQATEEIKLPCLGFRNFPVGTSLPCPGKGMVRILCTCQRLPCAR